MVDGVYSPLFFFLFHLELLNEKLHFILLEKDVESSGAAQNAEWRLANYLLW